MGSNGAHRNIGGEIFNADPDATRYCQRYRSYPLLLLTALFNTCRYPHYLLQLSHCCGCAAATVSLNR